MEDWQERKGGLSVMYIGRVGSNISVRLDIPMPKQSNGNAPWLQTINSDCQTSRANTLSWSLHSPNNEHYCRSAHQRAVIIASLSDMAIQACRSKQ